MNQKLEQLQGSAKTAKLLCRWLAVMTLVGQLAQAASPSTAFTYQGRLFVGDVPANGLYDLQFTNYDAAAGGNALGGFNTNALPVTNGLFTVTLDFGAVFDGTPRWLEISERTNGVGAFGTLAPRQLLAAAPYATYAASAGAAGAVAGLTILQNDSGAPNVIAGSPGNWVASGVVGATISGGGATNYAAQFFTNRVSSDFGTIGGGMENTIQAGAGWSTIGGGVWNMIYDTEATIGGDYGNRIQPGASEATIGGGVNNVMYASGATIGGGDGNSIWTNSWNATIGGGSGNEIRTNSSDATIGGGAGNVIPANANYATIPGGTDNTATNYAFAAGNRAQAIHTGAFVWADSTAADFSSTANNQFAARASGGFAFYTSASGGATLAAGSGSWTSMSDRHAKENFAPLDPQSVLAKVAALPLSTWNYKAQDPAIRHLGPMAWPWPPSRV
ncbi:MAG: tail fiber domain-containing protein [Verrucomicrobiota bacterium]